MGSSYKENEKCVCVCMILLYKAKKIRLVRDDRGENGAIGEVNKGKRMGVKIQI